jgi:hypothetical protein
MRTTKTRTTIAALAAVFTVGFATGPIAQDASAATNTHGYQRSSEAMKRRMFCDGIQSAYDEKMATAQMEYKVAKELWAAGAGAEKYGAGAETWAQDSTDDAKDADKIKADGKKIGCSWAAQ